MPEKKTILWLLMSLVVLTSLANAAQRQRQAAVPRSHRKNSASARSCLTATGQVPGTCVFPWQCKSIPWSSNWLDYERMTSRLINVCTHTQADGTTAAGVCCGDGGATNPNPPPVPPIPSPNPPPMPPAPRPPTPPTGLTPTTPPTDSKPLKCGRSKSMFRIVGGWPAVLNSYPWMAGLFKKDQNSLFCGGSLISKKHVLTAAHCVFRTPASAFRVRLGEYEMNQLTESNHVDIDVASVKVHEAYSSQPERNDIAIVRLAREAPFQENIRPICLPTGSDMYVDKTVHVSGWGQTNGNIPKLSSVLREVTMKTWTVAKCKNAIAASHPREAAAITEQTICGGGQGTDSCMGDSGGPMMIQQGENWVHVGIVSWGIHCGIYGLPGIYTRTTAYTPWIQQQIRT